MNEEERLAEDYWFQHTNDICQNLLLDFLQQARERKEALKYVPCPKVPELRTIYRRMLDD